MKMYIILKKNIPNKLLPIISAHASLACYKKYETEEDMQKWINSIFKKVVCVASDGEFEKLKTVDKYLVLTESALENKEVFIVFCPREGYPKPFKFLSMWKPTEESAQL